MTVRTKCRTHNALIFGAALYLRYRLWFVIAPDGDFI
jgi:hypothetical protein